MKFKTALEIATRQIISVSCSDTIMHATELMIANNLRNVLIVDSGNTEYGIITVADIAELLLKGVSLSDKLETTPFKIVKKIHKDTNALEASFLIHSDVTYLCVVDDDDSLLGVVSMSNIIS